MPTTIIGKPVGSLIILDDYIESGRRRLTCICDCGSLINTRYSDMAGGKVMSCGCKRLRTISTQGGEYGSKLYWVWKGMKDRCASPRRRDYKYYGARGIKVCPKWTKDFIAFKIWATAHGYADGLTIDRIDPDKGYQPSNCRFITRSENSSRSRRRGTL